MKKFLLIFLASAFFCISGHSEIISETSCYSYTSREKPYKTINFALRTYFDVELNKEVGAVIQYSSSKKTIPLVFLKYIKTDQENPGLENYEIHRLEVVGEKVTGVYILQKTGAGNKSGVFIEYKNYEKNKSVIFMKSGGEMDDPSCTLR